MFHFTANGSSRIGFQDELLHRYIWEIYNKFFVIKYVYKQCISL